MENDKLRAVDAGMWIAGQVDRGDLEAAAARGVRLVINNRAEGEDPLQPPSAEIAAACASLGMDYLHAPITWGAFGPDDVQAIADAIDEAEGPALAFCRTGTRSCVLWAMIAARDAPPSELIEKAAAQGWDLSAHHGQLAQIHESGSIL